MGVLALNIGSSTLKYCFHHVGLVAASGTIPRHAAGVATRHAVDQVLDQLSKLSEVGASPTIEAVGHRVVHGGAEFSEPVLIDARVQDAIRRYAELAPLHNPAAWECIDAVQAALPGVPQVAVFDTALYATLTPRAFLYPVPYEWYTDWGVRRFGFHGISHGDCLRRAAAMLARDAAAFRLVSCHLGSGCSATAFRGGMPLATTMGFTPLDGLMMGTRPGSIDPGITNHVLRPGRLNAESLADALEHRCGLLGVSGVSADYRDVEAACQAGNERAGIALDMFADRIRSAIGALTVTLGGLDALVFTGGVGEHSANLRAAVCDGLQCLGVDLDSEANGVGVPDRDVASPTSAVRILILRAREEQEIARLTRLTFQAGTIHPAA